MRVLLLTDLDNTLYNWVDYFAPSFRAMVHALSREVQVPEDELIAQFRDVYRQHGSIEYAFSVQELECMRGADTERIEQLIRVARGAFRKVRRLRISLYPNVLETLAWLRNNGVTIVGMTNASEFQAIRRAKYLHIERFLTGIIAWEGSAVPNDRPTTKKITEAMQKGAYASKIEHRERLTVDLLKPDLGTYRRLMEMYGASGETTFLLGDSLHRDVAPANYLGATGIWARYGTVVDPKNLATILQITPWSEADVGADAKVQTIPRHTIDDFGELRGIIPANQLALDL